MDNADGMRGHQTLENHVSQIQGLIDRHTALRNDFSDGDAIDIFHHQKVAVLSPSRFFHRYDMRVMQHGRGLNFLEVAAALLGQQERREHFDRHLPPSLRIARPVDGTRASSSACRYKLKTVELLAEHGSGGDERPWQFLAALLSGQQGLYIFSQQRVIFTGGGEELRAFFGRKFSGLMKQFFDLSPILRHTCPAIAILVLQLKRSSHIGPSSVSVTSREGTAENKTPISGVYDELRRLAAYHLNRERPDHTLQATALVHEAYLRLAQQESPSCDRVQFIAQASIMMRRVLVDHARAHLRDKRGGGLQKLSLSEAAELREGRTVEVLDLDCALGELAKVDVRKSRLVELRYFGGLTMEESAQVLGISLATAERDWKFSRAFLLHELGG